MQDKEIYWPYLQHLNKHTSLKILDSSLAWAMPSVTEECISTVFFSSFFWVLSLVRTHKNVLKALNLHSPGPSVSILLSTQYCKWGYSCLLHSLSPSLLLSLSPSPGLETPALVSPHWGVTCLQQRCQLNSVWLRSVWRSISNWVCFKFNRRGEAYCKWLWRGTLLTWATE